MSERICMVPDCGLPHHARGYCTGHFQRVNRHGDARADSPLLRRIAEDPWKYVSKPDGEDGCWFWRRKTQRGYMQVNIGGVYQQAHRLLYELTVGPIPEGLELDHTCHTNDESCNDSGDCRHRPCVNPAHLEPVTHAENVLRGRGLAAVNAARSHCIHGHPFSGANLIVRYKRGRPYRACRTCQDDNNARKKSIRLLAPVEV